MKIKKQIQIILIIVFFHSIKPHGFVGNTLIQGKDNQVWQISHLVKHVENKEKIYACSYDEDAKKWISKKIKNAGFSQTDYYCRLTFNNSARSLVECTPLQLFYKISDQQWIASYKLKIGDQLLCAHNKVVTVSNVGIINHKIDVYTLEIKHTHIFLVTKDNIVAHNMLIPTACSAAAFALPAEIGCGATIGSVGGIVGICAGVIVGGIVGTIVHACIKERLIQYGISYGSKEISKFENFHKKEAQSGNNDAQAPGKPTENDGFIPKKNWDGKKVKHSKTGEVGWPDEQGNVWKPTGVGSLAHGGPHWDVTSKDGKRHWNIVPGGKKRGLK